MYFLKYKITLTRREVNLETFTVNEKTNFRVDRYFYIWSIFLPITSFLLIPSIQGTTIGYLMAFASLALVPFLLKYRASMRSYFYTFGFILVIYIFILLLSQLSLSLSPRINFIGVLLINPNDNTYLLKPSMFTQSMYMVAAFATFAYVRVLYNENWNKYILAGATVLAVYGIYEVTYFLITGSQGDFISNRTFGDGTAAGSRFQKIVIGGLTLQRLKSLTGEPSMYAFTITPFFIYALYLRKRIIATILGASLLLSTSTTFFIGIVIGVFLGAKYLIRAIRKNMLTIALAFFFMGGLIFYLNVFSSDKLYDIFNTIVLQKLSGLDVSGSTRSGWFQVHMEFYKSLPLLNQIFGVGFGYIRSTDLFSTLMVNTGIFGTVLFSLMFIYPILKLDNAAHSKILKLILVIIFLSMMIAVPEYSYLSTWLFLGIAYNRILRQKTYKRTC